MSLVKVYIDDNIGNVLFDTKTGITYKTNWYGGLGDRLSSGHYIKNKILDGLNKRINYYMKSDPLHKSAQKDYEDTRRILGIKHGDTRYTYQDKDYVNLRDRGIVTHSQLKTVTLDRSDIDSDTGGTGGGGVRPRGTGGTGGTLTPPKTHTYNYNFSLYYTDNPNGDKSKPIAHNYFNADQYSSRSRAFKAARDAGHGVFTWRGKAYNTMEKGDNADEFRKNHSDYDAFIGNAHRGIQDGIDNSGGWSGSSNYKPEQIAQTANPLPANTPQQLQQAQIPQRTRLLKFTDDDIRSLGFNNYQGLLNAANNSNNKNNRFLQSMYDRYGSDTSKWNQATIENDLGVKGKYRRFGGGDFGDMSRSMMAWVGKNNGEIDKLNLLNRTGSNGTVYSSKEMKDLYEKYNPKKLQSSLTGTTQTNTSTNTPSSILFFI